MKVAVLVKQTPQLSEVAIVDGKAQWPSHALIINPLDEYAIEEAIRIKEKTNGTAIALSYGFASSEAALRDVLALGIDDAYLIENPDYIPLASQSTAIILAAGIKKIGDVDLVLTGKQASDDDSALMASAVAALLDWPQIGFVKKFDSLSSSRIVAHRTTDSGYDVVECSLPAVCSVVKEINEPRLPSLKGKMKAKKTEIHKIDISSLGIDLSSLIDIKSVNAPKTRPSGEVLQGEVNQVLDSLIAKLKADQLI